MGTTQADKIFTGTLVRRQYKPGQPCVQLVFQNRKGLQLSLSRNLSMIRSLKVGQMYRIEGPEYQLGAKTFMNEPEALPVGALPAKRSKKRWALAFGVAFAFVLTSTVIAARHFAGGHTVQAQSGGSSYTSQTAVQGATTQSSTSGDTTLPAADISTDTTTQQQTTPTTTTPTTPAPHTANTSVSGTQTTPAPAPSPAPTSTPAPTPAPSPPATNDKTTDPTPADPAQPPNTAPTTQQQAPTDTTTPSGGQPTTP